MDSCNAKELTDFEKKTKVLKLIPKPKGHIVVGIRQVFRNKLDDPGVVIRSIDRLIPKVYIQLKGIDYDEIYALVARLEPICIFLAYVAHKNGKVQKMDVKSDFLNGELKEEEYLQKPLGFDNSQFPNYYYKIEKVVYGLKQAPRAWYETLSTVLIDSGFKCRIIDPTLFQTV